MITKKLRNFFVVVASVFALMTPALVPAVAMAATADIQGNLCSGTTFSTTGGVGSCNYAGANSKVNQILKTVVNIFSIIVGVVAVVMIIVGGLKYITAGGEAGNISSAKNTIIYAIVGLVIVALAQFIVHFVLGKVANGQ